MTLLRRSTRTTVAGLAAATIVSLASSGWVALETAFYLTPFRVFEFGIGAVMV